MLPQHPPSSSHVPRRKTERKVQFTSNNPCFLLREFPSRVQKYRCDFPQVTMILVSVGWKSAANTASLEHFKKEKKNRESNATSLLQRSTKAFEQGTGLLKPH